MEADLSVIAGESANFQRIADELRTVMAHVEATAAGLQPAGRLGDRGPGRAGCASTRRPPRRTGNRRHLENLGIGGTQYASTDEDQASASPAG